MTRTTIRARLLWSFSIAILIPSVLTTVVAVLRIREQVYAQAQARVTADVEAAKEIYQNYVDRLRDAVRAHATRRTVYETLGRGDVAGISQEMERVRTGEGLDLLTLIDTSGRVVYRARNPVLAGDSLLDDELVRSALRDMAVTAGTTLVSREDLVKESPELATQAFMELTPTPRAGPTQRTEQTAGMMAEAAAPVFGLDGHLVGVLLGGVLLNRNYDAVDRITKTVFKHELYGGQIVGTATIFQDDVRVSTNVRNTDGTRAITTRASAEVAQAVLTRGETWRGRAFVVNDWYISAYEPIRDAQGITIGMLYVGTLERPYVDSLWRHLYVLLGITLAGVALVGIVAVFVAQRISRPVRAIARAAQKVAQGDYSPKIEVRSGDEIGYLAACFNRMTSELARAQRELREWGEKLERKVEQRTAEIKAIQTQMLQAEKLAAIGKLAAGVAHEINNPLTGVLTNASLMLSDTSPDDPSHEDLQTIVNETMRCRKIVKGLLEFARQAKPQAQLLDLNQVVEDVLGLVKNQASFRNIVVETAMAAKLPPVMADRDQLRQVVLNIVLNAAEAMGQGGLLRLSSSFDRTAKTSRIDVADSGPGIPEAIRARMFEPFFTTKKTGTGLGLAIVYGIVEEHKGTIQVASAPGKGTTMSVILPSYAAEEPLPGSG